MNAPWATRVMVLGALVLQFLFAAPPVQAAKARPRAPALLEISGLVVRLAPPGGGIAIGADRIAWSSGSRRLDIRRLSASLTPRDARGARRGIMRLGVLTLSPDAGAIEGLQLAATIAPRGAEAWALTGLRIDLGRTGTLTGAIDLPALHTTEPWRVVLASRGSLDTAPLAPALAWFGARGWHLLGRAAVDLAVSGGGPAGRFALKTELTLTGVAFSGPESAAGIAVDNLGAHLSVSAEGTLAPREIRWSARADAGGFELLAGVYYADLAGETILGRASGKLSGSRLADLDIRVSSPWMALAQIRGRVDRLAPHPQGRLSLEIQEADLERLYRLAVSEPLGDAHPALRGSRMRGRVALHADWEGTGSGWTLEGDVNGRRIAFERSATKLFLEVGLIHLPFHFSAPTPGIVPTAASLSKSDYGTINISHFRAGAWEGGPVVIRPAIRESGLRLRDSVAIPFFHGTVRIDDLEGRDLLAARRHLRFRGRVTRVDLGAFTQGIGLPKFQGVIDGEIPLVRIDGNHLSAPGRFATDVFGGSVAVSGIEVDALFSSLPRIGLDLDAREIRLNEATRALEMGHMSGVLAGSIRGLVIERGQPAAFYADFDTVDRPGVSKWVSADFVRDVATLFGNGNAVSNALNRGVNRFVERYRYDAFGFTCRLENDLFYPRGKIHRNGTEYLIWGRWNFVRIALRNRGRGIPFSFMVRQIHALASSQPIRREHRTPASRFWPFGGRDPAPSVQGPTETK